MSTHYFHTDALGSITAITNEHAKVIERRSYTPFGKIRSMVYGTNTITASLLTSLETTRGFTGHEFIGELPGLIHMNARVYDSEIGRFLSADTMIPSPYHSQSYNRYSYLNNNPLGDTDSTGHAGDNDQQSAEEFLSEIHSHNGDTFNDGDTTHTYETSGSIKDDGTREFDIKDTATNESGDKVTISVHGSIAVDGTTTMAATLSMIKDGSKVSYGTVSATFSPIGGGKAANGAKSASFANLFSSFKSISKVLAYEAFAMTPVGGVYDTLKQYNDGQLSGLMAIAMLGMNAVPGGAVVKRIVGKVGTRLGRIFSRSSIRNPIPKTFARVVPGNINPKMLSMSDDVFVTSAKELKGLNSKEIAKKLSIPESSSGFKIFEFSSKKVSNIASPINRTNPGFIGGGRTAGGASEFVIPNGPIPSGSIIREVQ